MRHANHNHILGVKKAHRLALMSNLAASLISHGRIQTTLAKAKALRPFVEKIITLAKKAHLAQDSALKVHYRRLAVKDVRNKSVVTHLFNNVVQQFLNRPGGYTRIYKLGRRIGDAAEVAIIEFVAGDSEKYLTRSQFAASQNALAAAHQSTEGAAE